ncbi:MAG: 50S ribosomal protein L3 [Candidatus Taylorbacteria bacterium CG11_big_fil_rev_8_21_14_0_20_46_11]|uniref:Large ribosomal subunit protein uL3 n=1 Tax=Candidatus Taylorbacteria bacterium CG11_big_fil_rev_8_21_14_0_20_46_11 TaxID=1975025 RepID=A0A2H0KCW6_9BACT|nr:MAG: 50S ribosomal protein L3 [Candidatus Taylorbacteria bacterium CG11_big_fil_rev_8_21_14_0_20_46_11]
MSKFILGTKQYMTQIWDERGKTVPVTVISAGPLTVSQIKTIEKDGYSAIQVGFGASKHMNQAKTGHLKDLPASRHIKEWRMDDTSAYTRGQSIDVSVFSKGDPITVSGVSKGKGFQGVVKRHGFKGGRRTHGQKHSEREPGSIGGGARAGGRVAKGLRMGGRMGGDRITVQGLEVVEVIPDENLILVKGAIPGRRGTLVEIYG